MAEGDILKRITKEIKEGIRKFAEENTGRKVSDKKIKAIEVYDKHREGDRLVTIEIGKYLAGSDAPN
mgnify:CR=1 FL=1